MIKNSTLLFVFSISVAMSACGTKSSEPKIINGRCQISVNKPEEKCVDYKAFPDIAEGEYAASCTSSKGTWTSAKLCEVKAGTRGCRLPNTGGGGEITTWYLGSSFNASTQIVCGKDQSLVTR